MKKIWSGIRSITNISKVKANFIPSILESGKTVDNPCAVANIFNNFFVNVGINTNKDIPNGNCCRTFFFWRAIFLIQLTEVDSYISEMDNSQIIGPYSIPVSLLIILNTHISPTSFIPN